MPDLSRILKARQPLTLAQVARGAQPLVMADLARASTGRAVFIAPDDAAMRSVVDAAAFFAPELEVIEFPAWDSLPYDRASPALGGVFFRRGQLWHLQRCMCLDHMIRRLYDPARAIASTGCAW